MEGVEEGAVVVCSAVSSLLELVLVVAELSPVVSSPSSLEDSDEETGAVVVGVAVVVLGVSVTGVAVVAAGVAVVATGVAVVASGVAVVAAGVAVVAVGVAVVAAGDDDALPDDASLDELEPLSEEYSSELDEVDAETLSDDP